MLSNLTKQSKLKLSTSERTKENVKKEPQNKQKENKQISQGKSEKK